MSVTQRLDALVITKRLKGRLGAIRIQVISLAGGFHYHASYFCGRLLGSGAGILAARRHWAAKWNKIDGEEKPQALHRALCVVLGLTLKYICTSYGSSVL